MLTKDAKTVLYELYKEYIVRRHNHISKSNAKDFVSSDSVMENQKKETFLTAVDFISKFIP